MFVCRPLASRLTKCEGLHAACCQAVRRAVQKTHTSSLVARSTRLEGTRAAATPTSAGDTYEPEKSSALVQPVKPNKQLANFCPTCGGKIELLIPTGEVEWRHVCTECRRVTYFNPKMVVGVICEHEGKILMCKRAIEPCRGLWTVPAGFMEMDESSAEGAERETWEEAAAKIEVLAPFAHFDIPRIGQAYLLFRAKLGPPFTFGTSPESLETVLMHPNDIPFEQVAFSSVSLALKLYAEDLKSGQFRMHHGVIEKAEGSLPNAPGSYRLKDHMVLTVDRFHVAS